MDLSDKTVVITGASRGIGQALARELARRECRLMLTALEAEELTNLANELSGFNAGISSLACDLADGTERCQLIDWIKSAAKPVDILINNAGMGGEFGKFVHQEKTNFEKIIALNNIALLHLTRETLPVLLSRPEGKIVNISSGIARSPYPGLAVYGASKGFISSFSESLACELYDTDVSVLCFHPGFTMTSFMQSSLMDMQKIPRFMRHDAPAVARRVIKAIRKDTVWGFSDFLTSLGTRVTQLLPERLKIIILKDLFWSVSDEN